eukprot:Opistho-1_new@63788
METMFYTRFLTSVLENRLSYSPVTLVTGPRQAGKTTLVKQFAHEKKRTYLSLDSISHLSAFQLEPWSYLDRQDKPLILDEIQRVPKAFQAIKSDVDKACFPGRYLLTSSVNPLGVPQLGKALIGRMAICTLWPLSQGEIHGVEGSFLERIFSAHAWRDFLPCSRKELLEKLLRGGFAPLQQNLTEEESQSFIQDYLFIMMQQDLQQLSKVERIIPIMSLVYAAATRVGSILNIDELARMTKTPATSLRRYLQLLESLFLLYKLPCWHPNLTKQLSKTPKLYFTDTALLLSILGVSKQQLDGNPYLLGQILENFVVMECVKQASSAEKKLCFYHYLGEKETQVPLVIEKDDLLVGIDTIASSVVRSNDLKGLKSLEKAAGRAFHTGYILYMGSEFIPLGEKFTALPLSALWSS